MSKHSISWYAGALRDMAAYPCRPDSDDIKTLGECAEIVEAHAALQSRNAELVEERDRLAGSLAACGVIARCDDAASFEKWDLPADNSAHTDSYSAVAKLRKETTAIRENVSGLQAQAKWLRIAGDEIAKAGHHGWGNTCAQAADAIDAALSKSSGAA